MFTLIKRRLEHSEKHKVVYLLIVFSALLIFLILTRLHPQRVGDGSEYYGLFLAWKETLRPWMSPPSFGAYQDLYSTNRISSMVPVDWFATAFPALRVGNTADFNHFWFYSFLAFVVAKMASIFGLSISAHVAFLGLHFILISATGCLSYYLYGKGGLATFVVMTLFSPMLWFYDKVHTELFTYCLTLAGVMLVFSKRYLTSAFMLALAATQNPSFALIAFVPFMYRFTIQRAKDFTIVEVFLVVGTAFAVLAHPIYYFCRLGVLTPQLLAGGATLGGNLSTFYIWLIDPDLGLLPNWPVGLIIIITAAVIRLCKSSTENEESNVAPYAFLALFFMINFYAHGSTENLNSGATPGLARYALWYLPATFPICYYTIRHLHLHRWLALPVLALAIIAGIAGTRQYNPAKPENYTTPSRLSLLIQTRMPYLYNPPAEVFAERYSGEGELIQAISPRGVVGPDCHKILVFAGKGRQRVTVPPQCMMDRQRLESLVRDNWQNIEITRYFELTNTQYNSAQIQLVPGTYLTKTDGNGTFLLESGWHRTEAWGVWSRKKVAALILPCSEVLATARDTLNVTLSVRPYDSQELTISQGGEVLYSGNVTGPSDIEINAKTTQCQAKAIHLELTVQHPRSPDVLGLTKDARILGIGLQSLTIKP
jgi:hypothetical protein